MRRGRLVGLSLGLLLISVSTTQAFAAYGNGLSFDIRLEKAHYVRGETVVVHGEVHPVRDNVAVVLKVVDPNGSTFAVQRVMPTQDAAGNGIFSFAFETSDDAPSGLWTVVVRYEGQYTLYGKDSLTFRLSDSLQIVSLSDSNVVLDGSIDRESGEWGAKYDTKYWRPFQHDPRDVESEIEFNAYYDDGTLYLVFDVPDRKFDAKDFVEFGLDLSNVGEDFKIGDDVYIFRIFRDGTTESFRMGTEDFSEETKDKQFFAARAKEGGDMRIQVFDEDGNSVKTLYPRDRASTSYKGVLGVSGLEVALDGSIYVLDSDSGLVSKFDSEGALIGSFGDRGTGLKEFIDPTGIALDKEMNIYVADTGNARVQKFDPQGRFSSAFGSMGLLSVGMSDVASPSSDGGKRHDLFESPESLVIDSSGNMFVVDRRAGSISVFDSNGNYAGSFGSLVSPRGIAMDSSGHLYVVEQGNNRVVKFDRQGNTLDTWGTFGIDNGQFKAPYGIAVDSADSVYVADSVNHRIQKFDNDGNFLSKWGERGAVGGQFNSPHNLAIDTSDNLYVVDKGNYRIQKFTTNGNFLSEFSILTEGEALPNPEAIVVDSDGSIYVTDLLNKNVQKYSADGTLMSEWGSNGVGDGEFRAPVGITVDQQNHLYVADPFNKRIQKFDNDGNLLMRLGSNEIKESPTVDDYPEGDHFIALDSVSHEPLGLLDSELVNERGVGSYVIEGGKIWKIQHLFRNTVYVKSVDHSKEALPSWTPDGIDVDRYGNVYIVDRENEIAKKFDSDGKLISKWGSTGSGTGQFVKPTAMGLDSENNIYIVDTGNNRIQKFDSDGRFIAVWGSFGEKSGEFNNPRGIAIDVENDVVYVLDNGNNRVQKFSRDGKFLSMWGAKGTSVGEFENLSTEGIAVDSQGMVYVADLPGKAKATHWISEVAVPVKSDKFGVYLAEGTYGDYKPENPDNPESIRIIDVYRNTWPAGAISILPETWAKAEVVDSEQVKVEQQIAIERIMNCTKEVCSELDPNGDSERIIPAGTDVIVTATIAAEKGIDKFYRDRVSATLQFSYDGGKTWTDADSKHALVTDGEAGVINLKWMPVEPGVAEFRITSSGLLVEDSASKIVKVNVQASDKFDVRASINWLSEKVMQDEMSAFEVEFATAEEEMLSQLSYDLVIVKDGEVVAELPQRQEGDWRTQYNYAFREAGQHELQIRIVGIGSDDHFIPVNSVTSHKVDVLPIDTLLKVNTIQKGESMKIIVKNREISNITINSVAVSLLGLEKVDFRLPDTWLTSVDTGKNIIMVTSETDSLTSGETMEFIVRSKQIAESLVSVCWELNQSSLVLNLC